MITQEYLHEIFDYDRNTGVFFRKKRTSSSVKIGDIAGCDNGIGYIVISVKSKLVHAHRLAWLYVYGSFPNGNIDHKNGNRSDNRICNLRVVDQSQNTANSKLSKANTSGFKGVTFRKDTNKWAASIWLNYKRISLGSFKNKEDAAMAYDSAANMYFKEFSRTNKDLEQYTNRAEMRAGA
jgi:hypothetical protein